MRGGRAIFTIHCPTVGRLDVPMQDDNDSEFDSMIEANRQAIDRLRSLTEDLTAVVEHEKRLVKDITPMLETQRARKPSQIESPEPAQPAPDPGSET